MFLQLNALLLTSIFIRKLYISGISNTDFASTLKVVDFPFNGVQNSASIEIYHTTHDQKETRAPIRTMEV